jgi:HK97 family phage portal protein
MDLFGLTITRTRTKAATPTPGLSPVVASRASGGWFPLVREPYLGAWQMNDELRPASVLSYGPVYACASLIAQDIGKMRLRLVAQDGDGIWTETTSPAFSPVLRKPNRYQTIIKFIEQWMLSKLLWGNTYALKQRDERGVVRALYILDPCRVWPLIAPDGAVYYSLYQSDLAQIDPKEQVGVPASEIIHDLMIAPWHPLVGVSPIYACGAAALQGLKIQGNSTSFFANGSAPGGVISVPGEIEPETAQQIYEDWSAKYTGENVGKVAVLGSGMKYDQLSVNAVDAQLIEQLKWTAETICSVFHVPPILAGIGAYPPWGSLEPLLQQYYAQCLQSLIVNFEKCLDEGLELPTPYGTELDIDDLIWMDTPTRTKAAADAVGSGAVSPDEARKKFYGLGPVEGGSTPYMQQQNYSLAALAKRDTAPPTPASQPAAPADDPTLDDTAIEAAVGHLLRSAAL